jgi:hypothetical protein
MKRMIMDFYQKLFSRDKGAELETKLYLVYHVLDDIKKMILIESVRDDEIRQAFFDIKPLKAHDPDFYQPYFYQIQWSMVGVEVCKFIRDLF